MGGIFIYISDIFQLRQFEIDLGTTRDVVRLIGDGDDYYLKNYIQNRNLDLNITVCNVIDGLNELYKIDLFRFFNINYIVPFNCLLNNDSVHIATIIRNSDGIYKYKKYSIETGKSKSLNIVQVVERLSKKSKKWSIDYLFKLFNIKVKYNKEIINKEFTITKFIASLNNKNLKKNYPYTYKLLGKDFHLIKDLMHHFIDNKFEYVREGEIVVDFISQLGTRAIANDLFIYVGDYRFKKTKERISTLTYLGVISKITDNELTEKILRNLNSYKGKKRYCMRKNILRLNVENLNLDYIENKCEELFSLGYSAKNFKYEFLAINGDLNDRDRVFPQNINQSISAKTIEFINEIKNYIETNLENNDYIFEKDLKNYLKNIYSKSFVSANYNICIYSAMAQTSTMKLKTTLQIKELYRIFGFNEKQRPIILVKSQNI